MGQETCQQFSGKAPDYDRKVQSDPDQQAAFFFSFFFSFFSFSRVNFLCLIITTVAHKRPRSFCQNCRWQATAKHLYILYPTHTPQGPILLYRHSAASEVSRKWTRNARPPPSKLKVSLWTDAWLIRVEFVSESYLH